MTQLISVRELVHAQVALFAVIALQLAVWRANGEFLVGPQYLLIPIEVALAVFIGFAATKPRSHTRSIYRALVLMLLGMLSVTNAVSLILVAYSLVVGHAALSGPELLGSAIAIFITNIIVFALWYWEIDSPGLSRSRWSKEDKDFQFTQQDMPDEFPDWRSEFVDYLYLSVTNAINFAPADTKPLTHAAKVLMGSQSLISVFILALVVARSVSILGS